jgi:uncharacterized protein (DUF2249 family)
VLMNLRAGQSIPEHATQGTVTVYAIAGHITFHEGPSNCELHAGEVVSVNEGALHKVEAHEDSALLVLATGGADSAVNGSDELDLREVPRPLRHPLVFQKFDALTVGRSFVLTNDHDPVPLNRQMDQMRPGQVGWEYLKRGPDIFRIRVQRVAPSDVAQLSVNIPAQAPLQEIAIT